jgi:hypothetical protein
MGKLRVFHGPKPSGAFPLSDDRTGDWTIHPRDVTVLSHSRILVERATHGDLPTGGPGEGGTGPVAAMLRVTVTCPYLPPVTNSFTIELLEA